jgi:DNA polymerase I
MIEAFIKGEDLHIKTASIVLGKSEKEITNEDRQLAKALNFGLLYGQSPMAGRLERRIRNL